MDLLIHTHKDRAEGGNLLPLHAVLSFDAAQGTVGLYLKVEEKLHNIEGNSPALLALPIPFISLPFCSHPAKLASLLRVFFLFCKF